MKRRILSIITALALCLSLCPTWAFAVEGEPDTGLCDHHRGHTADCGYAAPTEGHDCGHEHTEDCYAEETRCVHVHDESCYSDGLPPAEGEDKAADACTHTCTAESGCVTRTLDCRHSHDSECGYIAPTEGVPCGYVCRICPIEDLIAALPRRVTEDNRADVEAQLQKILALFAELPEDQQELVDISRCLELQEALDEASVSMPLADTFTMSGDITINSGNAGQYNGKTLTGTSNSGYTLTIDGAAVNLTISGLNFTGGNAGTIVLKNGATLNLTLQGSNRLEGGGSTAGITVPAGCSLTIGGTDADSLTVLGSNGGAGIGANYYPDSGLDPNTVGTITINGGKITATGSGSGAGIGGTFKCHTGQVVINSGTVTATSTLSSTVVYAAGIGGGYCGYLESITINGGTVTATGVSGYSAGIGAGYFNNEKPHGNTVSCGDIQINGGTVKDTVIGYGSTGTQGVGSVTIQENIDLPGCTVRPLPDNFASYTFQGTVYDKSITGDVNAVFSIGGYQREVTIKMLDAELYCGSFTVTIIMPPRASEDASLVWGGQTLTAADVSLSNTTSITFGTQEYSRYSISGTIYDGRITGNMEATVTFRNESRAVTLEKTSDYRATFRINDLVTATGDVAQDLSVTVAADGITWNGTTSGDTNKVLTIGRQLCKTRLIFWDGGITGDISVPQIQVTRNGIPLGAAEAASDNTLHMEQVGKGYLDVWMVPGENTGISVTVPGLNGGAPIEKTGLTIGTGSSEIEMYRGVSTDTPVLDLVNGDVIFDGSGGSLSVTYCADGVEKNVTGLSYDALHGVTQSSSGTPAANQIIVRNISQTLHLQIENINLDRNGSAISIEAGCAVELQTRGSNTVASSSMTKPAVYVHPTATLTLSGNGTLTANYTGTSSQFAAVIGGEYTSRSSDSGKIIIRSGTVNVPAPAPAADLQRSGAGIGGGQNGTGNVEIHGGTVTANSSTGAGIGGGSNGAGTVKIYGGIVTANSSASGSGIGGGYKGAGDVEIHGGTVTAKSYTGAGIGGGRENVGSVKILGGTVTASSSYGAGICGGEKGAGNVEIVGGTVTASSSYGAGIGGGRLAADAAVTITGGSINASSVSNPTNGSESVSLVTITLIGVGDQVLAADVEVEGGYGLHDVYTRDDGKLYFYLPADTRPTTITVGGVDYAPEDVGSTNYARALDVELTGYPLTKVYDGAPIAEPSAGQVTGGAADLTFTWYQDGTAMASAPVNAGSYVLKASSGGANRFFGVAITKRPLTITAQAQTIDYGGSIAQDAYTSSGLAAGDSLTVTLTPSETEQGTHEKAITVSSVMITRDSADVAGNYDITNNPGTLTIRKAAPTVSSWPAAGEITYGQALSASVLTGGSASIDGQFGWKDSSITPEKAGTHSYTVTFTPEDTNYDTVSQDISVTVNQAPLAITANKQGITYGTAVETGVGQVTASGLVNDDTLTAVMVSASNKSAGTYPSGITVTGAKIENNGTDVTANYAISYAAGELTIDKATLTATGAVISARSYRANDTAASVTNVTFTGLVNGETLTLGTDYTATGTFADASAGTDKGVTVTVILSSNSDIAKNYEISGTFEATGTITKADPVVTEVSVSTLATIYESTELDAITLTHGAGDTEGTVVLNPGQAMAVGTKDYNWTFTPTDANNYNTATGTISLTVAVDALQNIAVTTPPTKTTYTYGESFDKTGMVITATYASGATKDVTNEVQISPAELTVATTALTITCQGKTTTQAITVSPKTVSAPTIELSPNSFVYDGTKKKPAVTVKDGEKVIPADEYTVEYSNNTDVGTTATVTITDKAGGYYTVNGTKTFTITAKPLTGAKVEVTGTFTYTGSALMPAPTVTLDGKTLVKDTDYTVAYADNTNAGTAKITVTGKGNYSGTAQGTFAIGRADLTVDGTGTASGTYGAKLAELAVSGLTAKLGATEISGTWKLTGDAVPNVGDSGEYTATFTPTSGAGNYNALTAKVKLNIAKANYTGTTTASTSAKFGSTGTYGLSALLPDGATVETAATTSNIFEGAPTVSGKTLSYTLKAGATLNSTGAITVPVTSTNYNDFDLTITVTVTDKDVPTLTVSPITVTYTGQAIPANAIQGTAKVGDAIVPGTWAFASGEAVTNVADSGTKTVKFVPTDKETYAEATGTVVVTINKATPTGAPKYTAISASGKTLADAGLTAVGGTFNTEGTVAWTLDNTTEVTANTQYEWTFTPTDTANYTTLTGKITLWPYTTPINPGGGGGYVPSGPGSSSLPVTTTGQSSSTVTTTTTAAPTATTQGGTATTTINMTMGNEIVRQAVTNNSETVVIAPKVTGSVTKTEVSIAASTVGQIGSQTSASLTVSTPVADVTIPNGGLGRLSSAGGTVTVTAKQVGNSVELSVTAGGRTVQNIPGGVTLTVPAANTTPGTVAVLVHENGTREVVRKSVADNGTVTIPLDGSAKLEIVDNSKQFTDVPATSWAANAVAFASAHELFGGTGANQFSPDVPMSRGMLAVVLHNLESNPAQALTGAFTDVDNSQWYAEGVAWAEAQGIIGGYGNGRFGPNDNITREQLAVMLWRYSGSPAATDRELHFADADRASGWALEALRWATENGIINGKGGGILDPTGQATRAETAQMLYNFLR